jgi:integrase
MNKTPKPRKPKPKTIYHFKKNGLLIEKLLKKTAETSAVTTYLPLWKLDKVFEGLPTEIISFLKKGKEGKDFLFKGTDSRTANKNIKWIAAKAGIDKYLRYKDSRDTFGINLAAAKVPKDEIQILMGHSSVTTTEVYVKFVKKVIQRIFEDEIKSR